MSHYSLSSSTRAHLAVLAANLIFGANFSIVKYVTPRLMQPFGLNVLRVLVTTALFWLFFLAKPTVTPIRKQDYFRFILCGLTGVAINQMLFIKGLSLTYSTHGALLMLCTPILITGIAFWLLREPLTWQKMLGLLLGVSGAAILITLRERSGSGTNVVLGDMLIILNAISYAFYLVWVKPLMSRYHPLMVIRWVFTFGTLFILPFGWTEFIQAPWASYDSLDWSAIAFIVLGATFLAYLFNIYGVNILGASVTGSYIYLQPLFASLIAYFFLDESFTRMKVLSAVLIFTGVYLVNVKTGAEKNRTA